MLCPEWGGGARGRAAERWAPSGGRSPCCATNWIGVSPPRLECGRGSCNRGASCDGRARFGQAEEHVLIEALIAQLAVE